MYSYRYLQVEMCNVVAVQEPQPLQDLLYELDGLALQQVLLFSNEVK